MCEQEDMRQLVELLVLCMQLKLNSLHIHMSTALCAGQSSMCYVSVHMPTCGLHVAETMCRLGMHSTLQVWHHHFVKLCSDLN